MQYDTADSGEMKDPDFDKWYKSTGYKLFGGNRQQAQQWYMQRRRATKPNVASIMSHMRDAMEV